MEDAIKRKRRNDLLRRYAVVTLGCAVFAVSVEMFMSPADIATGGFTGIAMILNYVLETYAGFTVDTGVLILVLNIPMFILGGIYFGRYFVASTLYATILSSVFMEILHPLVSGIVPIMENDVSLISALVGGALFGLGMGLIFRMGSSTAGTDVIVKLLRRRYRNMRTGTISMIIDLCIVVVSAAVHLDFEQGFFSALTVVTFMVVFNFVLYGGNSARLVYIVPSTDTPEAMCSRLLSELDLGATYLEGKGAYTGNERKVIMCACRNNLYPKLRDIVREEDPGAFMIVSSAREIYGEGFLDQNAEEL